MGQEVPCCQASDEQSQKLLRQALRQKKSDYAAADMIKHQYMNHEKRFRTEANNKRNIVVTTTDMSSMFSPEKSKVVGGKDYNST